MNLSDQSQRNRERFSRWGVVMLGGIMVMMVGVLGRVVQLKVSPDARLAAAAGATRSTQVEMGRRGNLLDRRGRLLATSSVGYTLFIDPKVVDDVSTIALDVAHLIDDDPVRIDRLMAERPGSRYVVVEQLLEDWQTARVRGAKLKGVGLTPRLVRQVMNESTGALMVGRVGFEHRGQRGFESAFEEALAPTPGRLSYLRDVRRRALWIDPGAYIPARDGRDIVLSIDLVVQRILEERLHQAVVENNAGGGRAVVLDCVTGEILAMSDELRSREGWEDVAVDEMRAIDPSLGRNRCVTDPYEPGSTFKPFIWAVATALGKARPGEIIPTPRHTGHRIGRRLIRDSHYHPKATWREVLIYSLNTGMSMVSQRMTQREMQEAIGSFGFGVKTKCGFGEESAGLVTTPGAWSNYTQVSVSFGHEIAVTALQMVRAFSAFARDGTLVTLRLRAGGEDEGYRIVHRVLDTETVGFVREALAASIERPAALPYVHSDKYAIFGKSGTAQLPKRKGEGGGYHEDRYVSSFIAGAPVSDPRIVVLVVIDDPDRSINHYGVRVAGPAVRDIVEGTLEYLGVPSESSEPPDSPKSPGWRPDALAAAE